MERGGIDGDGTHPPCNSISVGGADDNLRVGSGKVDSVRAGHAAAHVTSDTMGQRVNTGGAVGAGAHLPKIGISASGADDTVRVGSGSVVVVRARHAAALSLKPRGGQRVINGGVVDAGAHPPKIGISASGADGTVRVRSDKVVVVRAWHAAARSSKPRVGQRVINGGVVGAGAHPPESSVSASGADDTVRMGSGSVVEVRERHAAARSPKPRVGQRVIDGGVVGAGAHPPKIIISASGADGTVRVGSDKVVVVRARHAAALSPKPRVGQRVIDGGVVGAGAHPPKIGISANGADGTVRVGSDKVVEVRARHAAALSPKPRRVGQRVINGGVVDAGAHPPKIIISASGADDAVRVGSSSVVEVRERHAAALSPKPRVGQRVEIGGVVDAGTHPSEISISASGADAAVRVGRTHSYALTR